MYGQGNYPPPFQQQPNLPPPSSLQQATPGPLPPPILLNQPHAEMRRAPPSPAPPQYPNNVPLPQQRTPLYLRPSLQPCLPPPPAYSQLNVSYPSHHVQGRSLGRSSFSSST